MPKEIPAIIENSEKERTKEKSKTTLTNNEHASGELNASYAQEVYAAQSTGRKSERDKKMNDLSERGQPIFDEANRGTEAWHGAMKNRNEQTASERQKTERSGGNNEVENLRNGMLDGKKRQHSPEDLARASEVRGQAESIPKTPNHNRAHGGDNTLVPLPEDDVQTPQAPASSGLRQEVISLRQSRGAASSPQERDWLAGGSWSEYTEGQQKKKKLQ